MNNELQNDYYKLWELLAVTQLTISRVRQKELRKYNISPWQRGILHEIHNLGDKATPATLARRVLRQPNTITEALDRMEKKGLVKRVKDVNSKKRVKIVLTSKGHEIFNRSGKSRSIHEVISSCLSNEEHQQLISGLSKMYSEALKKL